MAIGKPRFYWDAAPLIAWITNETRADPSEMDGLSEVVEMVERGDAVMMTSVLWRAEIVESFSKAQRTRLEEVFDGRTVIELSIDGRILDLASEIRGFHGSSKKKDILKKIRTPDAIHLATAILYDATEFHTFDGARSGTNPGGLLTLDGNVAGHRLKICVPHAKQLRINFPSIHENESDKPD
jgi:predicted nucleic acid-binding protein